MAGKPQQGMFPDVSNPTYISASEAGKFLLDNDLVFVVNSSSGKYIYPAFVLTYHHVVNDMINNKSVAVTFCLLSNSALLYSRKLGSQTLSMRVLSPLYFGNLVLYDRNTDSYWPQLTGVAMEGPLKGFVLESPVYTRVYWYSWAAFYPKTEIYKSK
jgi:hypothetical protein